MGKKTADSIITDAERLVQVWSNNPKFSMGELTLEGLKAEITKLRELRQSRDETKVNLTKLVNDTKDQLKLLDGYATRGRNAMKGAFGPDSAQYAQVGGTRQSERKPSAHRRVKDSQSEPSDKH